MHTTTCYTCIVVLVRCREPWECSSTAPIFYRSFQGRKFNPTDRGKLLHLSFLQQTVASGELTRPHSSRQTSKLTISGDLNSCNFHGPSKRHMECQLKLGDNRTTQSIGRKSARRASRTGAGRPPTSCLIAIQQTGLKDPGAKIPRDHHMVQWCKRGSAVCLRSRQA